jgi:hypothetical protein
VRTPISISEFDRRREEYKTQGFDLVESHLGDISELCDGLKSVNDEQVVIAHFDRRSEFAGYPARASAPSPAFGVGLPNSEAVVRQTTEEQGKQAE